MDLKGAGVLVTGASRGLGFEIARQLASHGARAVLVARDQARLDQAVATIRGEGGDAHGLAFDVGDKDAAHRISGAAHALVGRVDVLIHAASTLGPLPMPLLMDTACEDLERVIAVNLLGPFRLTKALAGPMVAAGHGLVIFVSSDAAVTAYPGWGAYGITKAAQDHLARSFACELDAVRFVAVDPGEMDTSMHADAMPDADRSTLARPEHVAGRITDLLRRPSALPSGARLVMSSLAEAS